MTASATPHSSDVREGGTWGLRQRLKNDAIYGLARTFLFFAAASTRADLRAFGGFLGACLHRLAPRERRRASANLARALPELPSPARAELLRRTYAALGEELGDVIATLVGKADSDASRLELDTEGRVLLHRLHAQGRGLILASAHLGNWERVGEALARAPLPVVAVGREAYDPRFDVWVRRVRERAGMESIARGERGAAFRLARALRQNKVLAIPMDLRARVASRPVPFLGHPADTAIGPARLALRFRAPVVVATIAPSTASPKPCVTVTKIETEDFDAHGDAGGPTNSDEAEFELTKRINDELSRRIIACPHLWPWMHPRWEPA